MIGFVGLHAVFLLILFIGIFPLIGIISIFFFLPSFFWEYLGQALSTKPLVKIYYDQDCGFCLRTVRLIEIFFLPQAQIAGAQTVPAVNADMRQRNSWVVLDATGARHYGYDAVTVVAAASPMLGPFVPMLRLQAMRWFGERLYRYVATHRQISCQLPSRSWCAAKSSTMRAIGNGALGVIIAYIFIMNLSTVPSLALTLPELVRAPGNMAGLDQVWNMFAPFPAKDDGWYVIPGRLRNGRVVDLFRGGKAVSFSKPAYASL